MQQPHLDKGWYYMTTMSRKSIVLRPCRLRPAGQDPRRRDET